MNPTHEIPHGTAPASPDKPAIQPASGIVAAPAEKIAQAKSSAEGVPADLTNLAVAAGLLLSAFLIFWMGSYLANHIALRTLVASFGTFGLVWVLYRLRVFHRQHGGLIAAGAVALFAAALPFIERGFQKLDSAAKSGLAGESDKMDGAVASAAQLPVPTRQQPSSIPPPVAPETAPVEKPAVDDTIHNLIPPPVNPGDGKIMRVIEDVTLTIAGKKYLIRAGSEFHFSKVEDGKVIFRAGKQDATIDFEYVSLTGKSKETPEEIRKLAEAEAMRRYPAIGVKNSDENQLYLARVADLKSEMPELMKDPHWPLMIAEELAAKEGWKRADLPSDDPAQPTPPAEDESKAPRQALPPEPSDPPAPQPTNVPQEAPPSLPPLPPAK